MADKIKKLRVKQIDGLFGNDIPLGAEASNVDLSDGNTVQDSITYINSELIRAEGPGEEVEDIEGETGVSGVSNYNDLTNKPIINLTEDIYLIDGTGLSPELEIDRVYYTNGHRVILRDTNLTPENNYIYCFKDISNALSIKILIEQEYLEIPTVNHYAYDSAEWVTVLKKDNSSTNEEIDLTSYAKIEDLKEVAFTGSYNNLTDTPTIPEEYVLPPATNLVLGGIKVGEGLLANPNGQLNVIPDATIASATQLGKVKIGEGISISADGTISASGTSADLTGVELQSNKITSLTSSSTNNTYPGSKAVLDWVASRNWSRCIYGSYIGTGEYVNIKISSNYNDEEVDAPVLGIIQGPGEEDCGMFAIIQPFEIASSSTAKNARMWGFQFRETADNPWNGQSQLVNFSSYHLYSTNQGVMNFINYADVEYKYMWLYA